MKRRWFIFAALVLIAGVAAIYAQTWNFEFLSYDDEGYTVGCPFVKEGLSWNNIVAAFRDPAWGGIWMPITYTSYMTVITLFGSAPGAQHIVSVVFHCINTVLFFWFLISLKKEYVKGDEKGFDSISSIVLFAAAALWAWHPLRVESVAWIASRKDTLFTLFTLCGLLAWLRAIKPNALHTSVWCCAAWLMMVLGCLCKPTAMVFPALAFSLELLFCGFALFVSPRKWPKYLPLLAVSAAIAALAGYSQTHATGEASHPFFYSTFAWRMLNAAVSLGMYLYHTVVPVGMQFWYRPVRDGVPLHTSLALVSLAVATIAVAYVCWRNRHNRLGVEIVASALFYLAAISPTLGIAGSFGNHALADRFTYVPAMAISILIVLCPVSKAVKWRMGYVVVSIIVLVAMLFLSHGYAATYRNNMTAFTNIAENDPGHCYAWSNIGSETIIRTGDIDKGIEYFRKSLALFPTDEAKEELAFALVSRNDPMDEAEIVSICMEGLNPEPGKPIPVLPKDKDPRGFRSEALGVIAMRYQDWPNAVICLETAVARDPEREDCRMRLAMSHWNMMNRSAARPHLEILSRSSRPDISAKARELLGMIQH